jgi:5,10-methylenetetrahydromethanopterin reductase
MSRGVQRSAGTQFWTSSYDDVSDIRKIAERREADGWDGLVVGDTQYVMPDPYVMLTHAAGATTNLLLATSVTNPGTRELSVTASAIASLHVASEGRAVLGIGRGDSALASVGRRPTSNADYERALRELSLLLHGTAETDSDGAEGEHRPIAWLRGRTADLPINAYATGEQSIVIGTRWADQVTFAVGADVERLQRSVETARLSTAERPMPSLGALVNIAPHPDVETSRSLVAGYAAIHARFTAMSERSLASLEPQQRQDILAVAAAYQLSRHGAADSDQTKAMPGRFIDGFCVTGNASSCVGRLHELLDLGLDRLILVTPGAGTDPVARETSYMLLTREVVPALRAGCQT